MFVCVNCFGDPGLVEFIREHAIAEECSFCLHKDDVPIAAAIDTVADYFMECVFQEYDLAANQLGWESAEGGWVGEDSCDAEELALHVIGLEFPQDNQDDLLPHLFGDHFDDDWCPRNAYGLNDQQRVQFSWEHFCEVVMHQRRYFFLDDEGKPYDREVYSPGEVLRTIFDYAQRVNLFRELPTGTALLRARWEGCEPRWNSPEELGPPPAEKANQPNRMSPAGIPMFYACDDEDTALKETAIGAGYFAIGQFETLRAATLLDLTAIPRFPSLFDPVPDSAEVLPRTVLGFLHHVAGEVSRPIERGERVHVDYVPTQVVTEFIRGQLTWRNSRVDGIRYRSSVHLDQVAYVLFANQKNVLETPASQSSRDRWLKLTGTEHRWVSG